MKFTDNKAQNLFQKFAAPLFRLANSVTRKKGAHDFMEDIIKRILFKKNG
jgi:hypothetical protein